MFVESRWTLIDLCCEAEIGGQHAGLDVLVVSIDEVADGKGGFGVKGAD